MQTGRQAPHAFRHGRDARFRSSNGAVGDKVEGRGQGAVSANLPPLRTSCFPVNLTYLIHLQVRYTARSRSVPAGLRTSYHLS